MHRQFFSEKILSLSGCEEFIETCVVKLFFDGRCSYRIAINRPLKSSISEFLAELENIIENNPVSNIEFIVLI